MRIRWRRHHPLDPGLKKEVQEAQAAVAEQLRKSRETEPLRENLQNIRRRNSLTDALVRVILEGHRR